MADPTFRRFHPDSDADALVALLTGDEWSFRTRPVIAAEEVRSEIAAGDVYGGPDAVTWLIELEGEIVGLVRADGLADQMGDPQLDFRLRSDCRGRGIGLAALRHITRTLFEEHPALRRIEGQTRCDNTAMRKVFERGGYVQEAVYRRAWPVPGEEPTDGVGYAILREDWESGESTPVDW